MPLKLTQWTFLPCWGNVSLLSSYQSTLCTDFILDFKQHPSSSQAKGPHGPQKLSTWLKQEWNFSSFHSDQEDFCDTDKKEPNRTESDVLRLILILTNKSSSRNVFNIKRETANSFVQTYSNRSYLQKITDLPCVLINVWVCWKH